ncbi:MAG: hypothetical protein LBQ75_02530 [Zoogloeaceae bacterium]|jgi:hypothetical protein|nr:hypothetical protein [Zoogloeaceae bacterium]
MEFRIKCDSLLYLIGKALLLSIIFMVAVSVCVIAVQMVVMVLIPGAEELPTVFLHALSEYFQEKGSLGGIFVSMLWISIAFFGLLGTPYMCRHDRLWIDERGIRFACHYFPAQSWQIAWKDIQLPIVYHVQRWNFLKTLQDDLYIQLHQADNQPPHKPKWHSLLFFDIGGNSQPDNPVFKLGMVGAWQANPETRRYPHTDQRPAVVHEIERYLKLGAIKSTHSHPFALARQAAKIQYRKSLLNNPKLNLNRAGQGVLFGALFLLVFGLIAFTYCVRTYYLFNEPSSAFFVCMAVFSAASSLLLLRYCKNAWMTSLVVALLCGLGFTGSLYSGIQFEASHYGQPEMRVFVLQAPLPNDPANKIYVWRSGNEWDGAEQPMLELETYANLARQPYHPGDRIELPVRRGVFGQYVLNIEDGYVYFKKPGE